MMDQTILCLFTAYQISAGCSISRRSDRAAFTTTMSYTPDEAIPAVPSFMLPNNSVLLSQYHFNICTNSFPPMPVISHSNHQFESTHYMSPFTVIFYLLFAIVSFIALQYTFHQRTSNKAQDASDDTVSATPNDTRPMMINNIQIILDYDDTLFPTQFTHNNLNQGLTYIGKHEWDQLCALNCIVYQTLCMFIELFGASNICIVSNSQLSWMNESCLIYNGLYENIRNLLLVNRIGVISATDSYRSTKSQAFMSVLRRKEHINKVISIGDSVQEYDDIDTVVSVLKGRRRRGRNGSMNYCRFKLEEKPSLNRMIEQLESIRQIDYAVISQHQFDESYVI
eukprot:43012_1